MLSKDFNNAKFKNFIGEKFVPEIFMFFNQFDLLLVVHRYHPPCVYIIPSETEFFNTHYIQNARNIFVYFAEVGKNDYESIDIIWALCYSVCVGGLNLPPTFYFVFMPLIFSVTEALTT